MKYRKGDKVQIRKDLEVNSVCGEYVVEDMKKYRGKTAKIMEVWGDCYKLDIDENMFAWTNKMFVKKTLYNLVEGDKVENKFGKIMVLGVSGRVYHVSEYNDFNRVRNDYTAEELEENDFKPVGQTEDDTIDVLGKTYKKSDVEERLAELEEIK